MADTLVAMLAGLVIFPAVWRLRSCEWSRASVRNACGAGNASGRGQYYVFPVAVGSSGNVHGGPYRPLVRGARTRMESPSRHHGGGVAVLLISVVSAGV